MSARDALGKVRESLSDRTTVDHGDGHTTTTQTVGGRPVRAAFEFAGAVREGDPTRRRVVAAVGAAALVAREAIFHPLDWIPGIAGFVAGAIRGITYSPESRPESAPSTARKVGLWTLAALSPLGVAGYMLGRSLVSSIKGKAR